MTETSYANPEVLEFYRKLPFNYRETVEKQAQAVRARNSVTAYPPLEQLLRSRPRVLDVGCGAGWMANNIAFHYRCDVTGIDNNPVAVERAQETARALKVDTRFEVQDLFLFRPEQKYDVVVSIGVLHHTDNCAAAVEHLCRNFVKPGGHAFIGLYHLYGRRPFLDHFANLKNEGRSEQEMFQRFRKLNPGFDDNVHALSWFRDQVMHQHETQHTLAEMMEVLSRNRFRLVSTSLNRFGPVRDLPTLLADEPSQRQLGESALKEGRYFPGFFVFLAQREGGDSA